MNASSALASAALGAGWGQVIPLGLSVLVMVLRWLLSGERRSEGRKRREEMARDMFDRALYRRDAHLVGRMLARRVRARPAR